MSRRTAVVVMAASIVLFLTAGVIWWTQATSEPRADLIGTENTTSTTTPTGNPIPPFPSTTTTPDSSTSIPATRLPAAPVALSIPSIGVESQVVPVGLEPDGELEVPPATQTGWYLHGPRPGAAGGTSVLAAHVDLDGRRGVFFELRSIEVGDEVTVTDGDGAAHRFVVTERYQVDKNQLPIEQIFVVDGPPGLTLITCGGSFDANARSYQDNIVVHTVPA